MTTKVQFVSGKSQDWILQGDSIELHQSVKKSQYLIFERDSMMLESDKELRAYGSTHPSDHKKHGKHQKQERHVILLQIFLQILCKKPVKHCTHEVTSFCSEIFFRFFVRSPWNIVRMKSLHSAPNFSSGCPQRFNPWHQVRTHGFRYGLHA